ncbi:MAG TPA: hypothetical protein VHP33_21370 [Polyangiaceae bacterium]|nr:hypothetical protein [Polyangiaceae bacterium]
MKRMLARGWVLALVLATACGGQSSREPQSGDINDNTDVNACEAGKQKYLAQREQVLQKASASGCQTDADCGTLWEVNACVSTCGTITSKAGIDAAAAELNTLAGSVCSSCPPIPIPPCVPPGATKCVQGQCAEAQ